MTRWIAIAMVLVVGAGRPGAQPAPPEPGKSAAELYEIGKRHFDITEYQEAITAWKQAYLLSSEPLLLFNIAQAFRLAGDCAQANRFYLTYRRVEPKPTNRRELEEAMAKCAGVEPATGDPTAPPLEPTGPSGPNVPSGPSGPSPDAPAVDRGRAFRIGGIAAAGAGAGIAAIVFALDARSKADKVASQPRGTPWDTPLAKVEQDGRDAQTRARIFTAVGVAAVAAGATLWWIGRSRSRARVDVAITPQQVSASCAF